MALAMEASFALAELATEAAADALGDLAANRDIDSEARCAAVWALGVAGTNTPDRVLPYIADEDENVSLHAIASVGSLTEDVARELVEDLAGGPKGATSAVAVLMQQGRVGIRVLLDVAEADGPGRKWAIAGLGQMPEDEVWEVAGEELPDDSERALEPLWALTSSWLHRQ